MGSEREDSEEIPIHTSEDNDPLIEETGEDNILEEDTGLASVGEEVELSGEEGLSEEDIGSYNSLPDHDENELISFDTGDTFIILLESRDSPFLGKVTEIVATDNLLKIVDDDNKELSFIFESGKS